MNITETREDRTLTLALEGRLDTTTAPQLETHVKSSLGGVTELVLEFEKLEYLSSAGLRVILAAQKTMNKQGKMVIRHRKFPLAPRRVYYHLAMFFRLAQTEYQRVTALHKQQEYKDGSQQGYYKPPIMLKKYIGIHVMSYEL